MFENSLYMKPTVHYLKNFRVRSERFYSWKFSGRPVMLSYAISMIRKANSPIIGLFVFDPCVESTPEVNNKTRPIVESIAMAITAKSDQNLADIISN